VRVFAQQSHSDAFDVPVVQNAPSLFYYEVGSTLYVAATHADGTLVGDPALTNGTTKASPGETVALYVNGVAPSPSGVIITKPIPYSGTVSITIGSDAATPLFTGLVEAGVFQINTTVPVIPAGNYPITVTVEGYSGPQISDQAIS